MILINPEGVFAEYAPCFEFSIINNEVEYEALIAGLRIAKELEADHMKIYSNL